MRDGQPLGLDVEGPSERRAGGIDADAVTIEDLDGERVGNGEDAGEQMLSVSEAVTERSGDLPGVHDRALETGHDAAALIDRGAGAEASVCNNAVAADIEGGKDVCGEAFANVQQPEQQVLGADAVVAELARLLATPTPSRAGGQERPVAHFELHSEEFEFGYGGSGPAELARCLLIDWFGLHDAAARDPKDVEVPVDYEAFKRHFIASVSKDEREFSIDATAIQAWVDEQQEGA